MSQVDILLVDDDREESFLVDRLLRRDGAGRFSLETASSRREMMQQLAMRRYDAILLDLHLRDAAGLPLIKTCLSSCPGVPVVVRTGSFASEAARAALHLGVQDFISKDQPSGELLTRTILHAIERKKVENETTNLAYTDPLTGLGNRRLLDQTWQELQKSKRTPNRSVRLHFFDVNGLKAVNDTQGHHAGDLLISTIANRLREIFGSQTALFRIGGDEFCAVTEAADTDPSAMAAVIRAESLLDFQVGLPISDLGGYQPSIACGLQVFRIGALPKLEEALKVADMDMYADKERKKSDLSGDLPRHTAS